jgi:hypothetical protein
MKKLELGQMANIQGGYNKAFGDGFCFVATWGGIFSAPGSIISGVVGTVLGGAGLGFAVGALLCEVAR